MDIKKKKVVMALSGGLDSTVVLAHLLHAGYEVIPVQFNYGSKHSEKERNASIQIAEHYGLDLKLAELPFMELFESDLLKSGGDIPEGHYEEENMKATVVPFRNGIFISILAGLAESVKADFIALGVHSGDHAIYPDCRATFIESMNEAIGYGSWHPARILAPIIGADKAKIVELGLDLEAPLHLTWTCYKGLEEPCGKCGSCVERAEAFEKNEISDPALKEGN